MIEMKQRLLSIIYEVFDGYVQANYDQMACREGCAACCTHDITATTLEAHVLQDALIKAGRRDLLDRVPQTVSLDIFRPRITTNTMAMACLRQMEPPVEEPNSNPGVCPFLENDRCTVYEARPMSCRGMFALNQCRPGEEAELPPELVTLVTMHWQIVEHLDAKGLYGNLMDLLVLLADEKKSFEYHGGTQLIARRLPPTRPVPGFLVPPGQEEAIQNYLRQLFNVDVDGKSFRAVMGEVRDARF